MDMWYDVKWLKYILVRSNQYRGYFCIESVKVGYIEVMYSVIGVEYIKCVMIWECVSEGKFMYGDGWHTYHEVTKNYLDDVVVYRVINYVDYEMNGCGWLLF